MPTYNDERPLMTLRGPDGGVIPPSKPTPPAPKPKQPDPPAPRTPSTPPAPPTTTLRGPTPDEIIADPLVRTVLDVFEGEVKRIHPRQKKPD